ncbi:MAG: 23S rRNA (guanosine(2251)-2'-O)-methyltransferase RlmB [Rubrobacter sp.]|nr:23S rRNA (guanosine(2251)-2'-O)-methyltransferase RlmB [Rubrobacter sp.]
MKTEFIYGVRPVIEALRSPRREVHAVLAAVEDREVAEAAAAGGVGVEHVRRGRIEELAAGGVHQGIAARVGPYPYSGLDEMLEVPQPLILMLDGVTDPRNLGAVLRAADGAGASGVVVPKDRAAGVTAAAVKASAGASEHVRVARETNLRRALDRAKKAGAWAYAAEGGGELPYTEVDLAGPAVLVLGSEGKGVRRLVREGCDGAVSIPMSGAVSSLNVSVASAVLLFEARRQRG